MNKDNLIRKIYSGLLSRKDQCCVFQRIDEFFPTRIVKKDSSSILLKGDKLEKIGESSYMDINGVTGLLVLKNGSIALEKYKDGCNEHTKWSSWSIAKSICSTLVGVAIKDGLINLDDELGQYMPELVGGSYENVTVQNLLNMTSGVSWSESYSDPTSDRRKMLELQIKQKEGSIVKYLNNLPRISEQGLEWNYSTGETHMLGALVKDATKKNLSDYLSEKIWNEMEEDASWWLESENGLEVGGSGFSATLRDYGRFGQFILNEYKNSKILPENWVKELTESNINLYKNMWWQYSKKSPHRGAFAACGIFNQCLYINIKENVVIIKWGTTPDRLSSIGDEEFFLKVINKLR